MTTSPFDILLEEDEKQETVVMGRKIMELAVKMYNVGENNATEEE